MTGITGIIPRAYKSGSIIYFEGDKSGHVYILKSGRVILTSVKLETGEEVKESVRQGEFFGVKSSLGNYPREETAQTVGDTVVLVMPPAEFERLVLNNVNVVRKMLRVFSNQLRRMVKAERAVMGEEEAVNPEVELYHLGEYYLKNNQPSRGAYAFKRYMEYYPDGEYASAAMQNIKAADTGAPPVNMEVSSPQVDNNIGDFDGGFSSSSDSDEDFFSSTSSDVPPMDDAFGDSPLSSEMDDFLSDSSTDDFSFDMDDGGNNENISDLFEEAERYFGLEDWQQALGVYEKVIIVDNKLGSHVKDFHEQAHLKIGRCQLETGQVKEALSTFNTLVQEYPQSAHVKGAYFYMGEGMMKAGRTDKALPYFNKVLNMSPKDSLNQEAMSRIQGIQKG